ncbi:hypothetical protein [Oleiagrimonas sp. C23AA]|uniref:hypothetical protein n=1 Tax=Oleiagrimonas sp. C23AA TaxID=2719047 RepID=UPI00141D764D|nr:hypothetical protein [Oleiagrimonas sp. C23AA]NII10662.1 hypothetical protein [Oleiagrimonas sp. C23AA]
MAWKVPTGASAHLVPRDIKATWIGNVLLTLSAGCLSRLLVEGAPHDGVLSITAWIAAAAGTSIAIAIIPLIIAAVGKFRSPGVYLILLQVMFFVLLRGQGLSGNTHETQSGVVSKAYSSAAVSTPPKIPAFGREIDAEPTLPAYQIAKGRANWKRDEANFEYLHPDIEVGNNLKLVQQQINRLPVDSMTNTELLSSAYAKAQADPQWKLKH